MHYSEPSITLSQGDEVGQLHFYQTAGSVQPENKNKTTAIKWADNSG